MAKGTTAYCTILAVVALACATVATHRARQYEAPVDLFGAAVAAYPCDDLALIGYGRALENSGRSAEAEDQYRKATVLANRRRQAMVVGYPFTCGTPK